MISIIFSIKQWLRITLSLIYLTFIALLSLLPPKDFPPLPQLPGADKIVHIIMYFGLAAVICWSMHAEIKRRWFYLVMLFAISWGLLMELFQLLMHLGRSFEYYDIAANSLGAIAGVSFYSLLVKMKKGIDSRKLKDTIIR